MQVTPTSQGQERLNCMFESFSLSPAPSPSTTKILVRSSYCRKISMIMFFPLCSYGQVLQHIASLWWKTYKCSDNFSYFVIKYVWWIGMPYLLAHAYFSFVIFYWNFWVCRNIYIYILKLDIQSCFCNSVLYSFIFLSSFDN